MARTWAVEPGSEVGSTDSVPACWGFTPREGLHRRPGRPPDEAGREAVLRPLRAPPRHDRARRLPTSVRVSGEPRDRGLVPDGGDWRACHDPPHRAERAQDRSRGGRVTGGDPSPFALRGGRLPPELRSSPSFVETRAERNASADWDRLRCRNEAVDDAIPGGERTGRCVVQRIARPSANRGLRFPPGRSLPGDVPRTPISGIRTILCARNKCSPWRTLPRGKELGSDSCVPPIPGDRLRCRRRHSARKN